MTTSRPTETPLHPVATEHVVHPVLVDSSSRDLRAWPSSSHFRVQLPSHLRRITRVELVDATIPLPEGANMQFYTSWSSTVAAVPTTSATTSVARSTWLDARRAVALFAPPTTSDRTANRWGPASTYAYAENAFVPTAAPSSYGIRLGRVEQAERYAPSGAGPLQPGHAFEGAWTVVPLAGDDYSTTSNTIRWRPRETDRVVTDFGGRFQKANDQLQALEIQLATGPWLELGDLPDQPRLWPLPDEIVLGFPGEQFTVTTGGTTYTVSAPSGYYATWAAFLTALAAMTNSPAAPGTTLTLTYTAVSGTTPAHVEFANGAGVDVTFAFTAGTMLARAFPARTFTVPASSSYTHYQVPRILSDRFTVQLQLRVTAERT